MKILCPCPELFSEEGVQILRRSHEVLASRMGQLEFENTAPTYDCVLVRFSHQVNRNVINERSSVRYVITPTTGLTHIDSDAVVKNGVTVFHLRKDLEFLAKLTNTAEHSMGLLLSLTKNIPQANAEVRSGKWITSRHIGSDLKGKTIGIVGFGRVGAKFSELCKAFEMNVIAYSPRARKSDTVEFYRDYAHFLSLCDVLSFHVHASSETNKMLNMTHLRLLKPGVTIINTSRAEVIDQEVLIEGLKSGIISGIGLDVLDSPEQKDCSNNRLVRLAQDRKNVVITPHLGGMTREAILKADMYVINKFLGEG